MPAATDDERVATEAFVRVEQVIASTADGRDRYAADELLAACVRGLLRFIDVRASGSMSAESGACEFIPPDDPAFRTGDDGIERLRMELSVAFDCHGRIRELTIDAALRRR